MSLLNRGRLELVENLDRKDSANAQYLRVLVWDVDAHKYRTLILTANQVAVATGRTIKNPEDEIQPSWLDKII
tara:strand:+ start:354 stop:572 length:219 start_codon:yes stop_codon:yes gene_type:complete